MSKKINRISQEEGRRIFDFFSKMTQYGHNVTAVGEMYNAKYGTSYHPDTLRKRFDLEKKIARESFTNAELAKREFNLTMQEAEVIKTRHKLSRERTALNQLLKREADKELVAEIFANVYEGTDFSEMELNLNNFEFTPNTPILAYGDVHLGFEYGNIYNTEIALERLETLYGAFNKIAKGLPEIIIVDMADHIEGRGLRVSQLAKTSEDLADQTSVYAYAVSDLLVKLAKENPDCKIHFHCITDDNHSEVRLFGASRGDLSDRMAKLIGGMIKRDADRANMANLEVTIGDYFNYSPDGKGVIAFEHGDKLPSAEKACYDVARGRYGLQLYGVVRAHFHNYKHTTLNVVTDGEEAFMPSVVTIPSIVGSTDYSDRLGLISFSGFSIITYTDGIMSSNMIRVG